MNNSTLSNLKKEISKFTNPEKAKILQRFFKTGIGEYGEGDIFLGITVPQIRGIVKSNLSLQLNEIQNLLNSKFHEERLSGLLILVKQFEATKNKDELLEFYLANTTKINNWDLVDLTAPNILGSYLLENSDKINLLYSLAKSESLWERRISIVSTYAFIRQNKFKDTLKISKILLDNKEDLIHKAVGWMLREVGKRDKKILEKFLEENYSNIPRTTLRYAIEKFLPIERKSWLLKK